MNAVSNLRIDWLLDAFKEAEVSLLKLQQHLTGCSFDTMTDSLEPTIASSGFEIAAASVKSKTDEIENLEKVVRTLLQSIAKETN
jgi:hypothetical protein